MDVHTKAQRSFNMSQVKGKNTKPELVIRSLLWHNGYRYRLYSKKLPGKPDLVFPSRKKVIFVNGCFWHKHNCKYFKWPSSRQNFWRKKICDTVVRDQNNYKDLAALGWKVLVVWECDIKDQSLDELFDHLRQFLDG